MLPIHYLSELALLQVCLEYVVSSIFLPNLWMVFPDFCFYDIFFVNTV